MKETTTVEVLRDAKTKADDAIESLPRDQRPTTKDFASEAFILKAQQILKTKRFTRLKKP
jgi:hypothetical protein